MNNSSWLTFTFCRKCKKIKNCLRTIQESPYTYLCIECAGEEKITSTCRSCGREGIEKEMNRYGGYCHLCEDNNISECNQCGAETYIHNLNNGICIKCETGINKQCVKCGVYINTDKLTSDNICPKCAIKLHKQLRESGVDEIVECIECGREELVSKINNGLCIYCYAGALENDIKKLKKKSYSYI